MPAWVEAGTAEYQKRLPPEWRFEFRDIPLAQRGKNTDIARAIRSEGEAMLAAVNDRDLVIALDVKGKTQSTEQLAQQLQSMELERRDIAILIGGPDGLADDCLARAERKWSLSALTMPHPLVRVLLVEQLYRAWSINHNHPYHRSG